MCIQQHTTEFGISAFVALANLRYINALNNNNNNNGIYGLVIDKYTITECATTAARGDFPLHHSSL